MPVEIASQVEIGYQDELWIGRSPAVGGQAVFQQIFGVETLNMPDRAPEAVDVTHQQSPGRTRETIPGLMSAADWSQELQFWQSHESHILLDELASKTATGEKEDVVVEFVVGGMRRSYRGHVTAFTPQSSVGDKRKVSLAMKIFNRILPDPRVMEGGNG